MSERRDGPLSRERDEDERDCRGWREGLVRAQHADAARLSPCHETLTGRCGDGRGAGTRVLSARRVAFSACLRVCAMERPTTYPGKENGAKKKGEGLCERQI